jgi:hypothetical protein
VATDILSHTQVLDPASCVLVPPTPDGLADGIGAVLGEGANRRRVDQGARALRAQYGIEQYVSGVCRAYHHVGGDEADAVAVGRAAERIREATAPDAPTRRAADALLGLLDHPAGVAG